MHNKEDEEEAIVEQLPSLKKNSSSSKANQT